MSDRHGLFRLLSAICLVWALGVSVNAYATTTFTWKEEVLLHDGKKIIVERSDIYDSSMNHEIGQGSPLAEHKTTFLIPGTSKTVIWKSDNRPTADPDSLHLLALDFLDDVPYVATTSASCVAYIKWKRPNPPYVFFKYADGWKHIPLEEFPSKFKINVTIDLDEPDKNKVTTENREYGFVHAQAVEEINREPGRSKEFYTLFREPIDLFGRCPEYGSGFKAPFSITPPNIIEEKK